MGIGVFFYVLILFLVSIALRLCGCRALCVVRSFFLLRGFWVVFRSQQTGFWCQWGYEFFIENLVWFRFVLFVSIEGSITWFRKLVISYGIRDFFRWRRCGYLLFFFWFFLIMWYFGVFWVNVRIDFLVFFLQLSRGYSVERQRRQKKFASFVFVWCLCFRSYFFMGL